MNTRVNIKSLLAAGILAAAFGTGGVAADAPQTIKISAKDFMFSPATVTVKAGATVTWVNLDDEPHTVFSDALFRSSALDTKDSFSFKFDKPGTYPYHCTQHPFMKGVVIVK
ncbi:MAG TPA: cupredoxin family copper-binding protein [Gemmatimonadales bacterium]|nr:cupredoxin family copper-binding protein [Gemmatimonadales bacterium]